MTFHAHCFSCRQTFASKIEKEEEAHPHLLGTPWGTRVQELVFSTFVNVRHMPAVSLALYDINQHELVTLACATLV